MKDGKIRRVAAKMILNIASDLPGLLFSSSHTFTCELTLFLTGWTDALHCEALLNDGSWLDGKYRNWQPDGAFVYVAPNAFSMFLPTGCILRKYTEPEVGSFLQSKGVAFVGDS